MINIPTPNATQSRSIPWPWGPNSGWKLLTTSATKLARAIVTISAATTTWIRRSQVFLEEKLEPERPEAPQAAQAAQAPVGANPYWGPLFATLHLM